MKDVDQYAGTDEICHHGICYVKRRGVRYKYKLTRDYPHPTGLRDRSGGNEYLQINSSGKLEIRARYAWDGPSGPSIDTKNFMRGSLVHDALYQLMRERVLDHMRERKYADKLLRQICKVDGMNWFRRWYVYWIVRATGASSARPRD